jgi:hypothetical protein
VVWLIIRNASSFLATLDEIEIRRQLQIQGLTWKVKLHEPFTSCFAKTQLRHMTFQTFVFTFSLTLALLFAHTHLAAQNALVARRSMRARAALASRVSCLICLSDTFLARASRGSLVCHHTFRWNDAAQFQHPPSRTFPLEPRTGVPGPDVPLAVADSSLILEPVDGRPVCLDAANCVHGRAFDIISGQISRSLTTH